MNITNISEAESILQSYIPNGVRYSGDDMTLERMWPLLQMVGNPQDELKVIHVAGTSGKTSTCYYIAALLQASGKKVGLTVSPHVDKITERVQVNNQPMPDDRFCTLLEEFLSLIDDSQKPSYFELLIAFVYWVFAKENVDYAVIETGMGGLYDGTNVVSREDKVCVITDIGFDHMHILGNTLPEIAAQKAGIVQNNNDVFCYEQSGEIMSEIQKQIFIKNAKLHITSKMLIATKSQLALFQRRNFNLALQVCGFIARRDGYEIGNLDPLSVVVPGRMERQKLPDGSTLVMDGAHNGQKIRTFVESFVELYGGERPTVVLALKSGKEFKEVIDELKPIAKKIILTTFSTSQDLPAVSQDPLKIQKYCAESNVHSSVVENHEEAMDALLASDSRLKLVIGSFYLLGQVRSALQG